ncbi:hypothetical protein JCM16303_005755 [Sporobolomyces ruberrimus]
MPHDWAQLKAKRASKSTGTPRARVTSPPPSSKNLLPEPSAPVEEVTAKEVSSKRLEYDHRDLPPSLSVHSIPNRGRGIIVNEAVIRGSTLLSTTPLVSVLDNRNLSQRCSACCRSSEDIASRKPLQQCSLCHIVQYCSSACQHQDWSLHKFECKAMRQMSVIAKEQGHATGKGKGKGPYVPDTPVRAIARLLWRSEVEGESFWKHIESLESHRDKLSHEEQERFFHLSMAISTYVGQATVVKSCPNSAALIDLLSRFTSNSFSLTSPTDLTNIGVSISPLTALFNHSCTPNAVVVFPSFPSPASPLNSILKNMRVIAIRTIEEGEEVLTSYVDLGLTRKKRRDELRERYKFECRCEACGQEVGTDSREAFECPREGCDGLVGIFGGGGESTCSVCREIVEVPEIDAALKAAEEAYEEAEKTQYSDPAAAQINLSNLISSLTSFSPRLSPTSYPLHQAYTLLLTLQLHSQDFSSASATAQLAWRGATKLYSYGHPVRCILSTTIARLASTPPSTTSPEEDLRYWSNLKDRSLGVRMMVEALRECEVGFGKGGGEVGKKLRELVRDQEEGIEMARKLLRETQA